MLFSKLKDFEKEFLFSRVSSNLDVVQGALQFHPEVPKGKSSNDPQLKESINEVSRQSTETVDQEKFRNSSNNSILRS